MKLVVRCTEMVLMTQLLEQNLRTSWSIEYNIILVHLVIALSVPVSYK